MNDPCKSYIKRCAVLVAVSLFAVIAVNAASIPAWLDDAITQWNKENPDVQIQFVDIKDQYVWYTLPQSEEIGSAELRERIYGLVERHKYTRMEAEELVITGKPPTSSSGRKKCWQRGFVLRIDSGRERMLTTQVCADGDRWFAGFRIAQ